MTDKPTITQAGELARSICDCCHRDKWLRDVACIEAYRESAVAELQAEVERLNNAIEKICIESNSDWAKVRDEPRAQIDVIHNIAVDAFFYKHALAQKEPVE